MNIRIALIFAMTFLSYWIGIHLIYAFIYIEWSLFTEWEPIARALHLLISVWLSATYIITSGRNNQNETT